MAPTRTSGGDPVCGQVWAAPDGQTSECAESGPHRCAPRADRVQGFIEDLLLHTKDRWARTRFVLAAWQRNDIVRPLFGDVLWDPDLGMYRRRYSLAWVELARKNGKSELLAALALVLLLADDCEGAEVYGAAVDREQAHKVFDVAKRMVELSPVLSARCRVFRQARRIVCEQTASYYQVVAADAAGNVGHNPHGVIFDEVWAQRNRDLWDALRTGMGTRSQPLMIAATTAGNDTGSWAARQHDEMLRVAEDPARAPHVLVYARNTPADADVWDEATWSHANPALGEFLDIRALREEATEARNDPAAENAFRQYRLNQWVSQVTRWLPLGVWDGCAGMVVEEQLAGARCWGGLDLSATTDLTALAWWFPDPGQVLWRFWIPEARLKILDGATGGAATVWAREGALILTEGEVVDYDSVHDRIARDAETFDVAMMGVDRWNSAATMTWLAEQEIPAALVPQGYRLSPSLKRMHGLLLAGGLNHGGHPVARWCADAAEVRQDDQENIRLVKPDRGKATKRVDGIAALADALAAEAAGSAVVPEPCAVWS